MITSLAIENYALIEKLSISFSNGFTTITGETGAGKSILLGALGLVLGNRADLSSLKNKEEKCVIEAQFSIKHYNLQPFFEANDLDYEPDTIIRREILPSGKSRAFINDTPVNLTELQALSSYLIDIHSQHQTQELSNDKMQFQILDAVANNGSLITEYEQNLKEYKKQNNQLTIKKEQLNNLLKEQEYNTFLLQELLSAKLKMGEQEQLESDYEKLTNVGFIKENLVNALNLANEEQYGVLQNLKEIKIALQKITSFSTDYQSLFERLNSVLIEFDDIQKELQKSAETIYSNPQEVEFINEKLQLIYNLQKKHQVKTIDELLAIQNDLDNKVLSVEALENDISNSQKILNALQTELDKAADTIHTNRVNSVAILVEKLLLILHNLGMPNAQFNIAISHTQTYYANGKDEIEFLFSANKGTNFGLLKKVASGGEMSRIMLAVKAVLSHYSKLPTLIFDEIDTGVSGEIAHKMAEIMMNMSQNRQVFAITHLPQIAAKGKTHLKVYKIDKSNQTTTQIKILSDEERVIEIAQMLSGLEISQSALTHARELLN